MMLYTNLPAAPMFGLRREIDRLFEDAFGRERNGALMRADWAPVADVREEEKHFVFEMDIPGIEPQAVEVTADKGFLTVKGERSSEHESEGNSGRWHLTERTYGSFHRAFQLPASADEGKAEATFKNGVLTVRVPKIAQPEPKRIAVKSK